MLLGVLVRDGVEVPVVLGVREGVRVGVPEAV